MNKYIKILSTRNSHNFPIRYLMVYPLPHISQGANFVYFCVICISKTPTFVLLFYTFSYFIPTFPKILVLLLSYFSTQGCQKACVRAQLLFCSWVIIDLASHDKVCLMLIIRLILCCIYWWEVIMNLVVELAAFEYIYRWIQFIYIFYFKNTSFWNIP